MSINGGAGERNMKFSSRIGFVLAYCLFSTTLLSLRSAGASNWNLIAQTTVAANTNDVQFSGISINNSGEFYIVVIASDTNAQNSVYLFYNGDTTTTDYYSEQTIA